MTFRHRRPYSATFKAQVALDLHPNQIAAWKAQLFERNGEVFGSNALATPAPGTVQMKAKAASSPWRMTFRKCAHQRGISERNKMIKPVNALPVVRERKALRLHRTTIYRKLMPAKQI